MKKVLGICALLLTVGCGEVVWRPYVGEQQSWPTAQGSICNIKHEMPIFTSLPPAPYDILGELRVESPWFDRPEEGHMPEVAARAREIEADAVLFVQGRIYFSTNYGPRSDDFVPDAGKPSLTQVNTFNPESFERGVTILAIRWVGEPPPGLPRRDDRQKQAPDWVLEETPQPPLTETTVSPTPVAEDPPGSPAVEDTADTPEEEASDIEPVTSPSTAQPEIDLPSAEDANPEPSQESALPAEDPAVDPVETEPVIEDEPALPSELKIN